MNSKGACSSSLYLRGYNPFLPRLWYIYSALVMMLSVLLSSAAENCPFACRVNFYWRRMIGELSSTGKKKSLLWISSPVSKLVPTLFYGNRSADLKVHFQLCEQILLGVQCSDSVFWAHFYHRCVLFSHTVIKSSLLLCEWWHSSIKILKSTGEL